MQGLTAFNAPVTVNPHPGETWGISHKAKPNKDNVLHTRDIFLGLIPTKMRIIVKMRIIAHIKGIKKTPCLNPQHYFQKCD